MGKPADIFSMDPGRRFPDGEALVEALRACRDELAAAADAQTLAHAPADGPAVSARRGPRARTTTTRLRRTPTPTPKAPKPRTPEAPAEPVVAPAPAREEPKPGEQKAEVPATAPAEPVAAGDRYPPLAKDDVGKPEFHMRWPFDEYAAQQRQKETARATGLPERMTVPLGGDVGMDMVLLPAGEFLMGSPHHEEFREKEEAPHYVRLPRPLYMALSPVTQAQWKAVAGGNASRFKELPDSPQRPVERVSWNDIHEKFLPRLQPLAAPGWELRLPTEAEWEYGCRAGTETPFNFGLAVSVEKLNCKEDRTSGSNWKWVYRHDLMGVPKERLETTPVGTYPPNAWGLLDVHGNVWEWCEDWYDAAFYQGTAAVEPRNTTPGEGRVLRGGSWNYSARYCRAACRYRSAPDIRNFNFGFRVVCAMTGRAHQVSAGEEA
ncbi:MAG: SUMF1/EgtB/PvdO family nonheme iron enzyme [Planctomycetota bacterium]|nr:SUMF1/EgtB/PvdO family nonheme iron enzyme [Planctomycetota bacterium]